MTNLNSKDNGVEIAVRQWNLNDIYEAGEVVSGAGMPICVQFFRNELGPGAVSFDTFDLTTSHSGALDSLLLMCLHAMQAVRIDFRDTNVSEYPIAAWLEAILEDPEVAAARVEAAADGKELRHAVLKELYGERASLAETTTDESIRASALGSSIAAQAPTCRFLAQHRGQRVVGYRLWIFQTDESAAFIKAAEATLKHACKVYYQHFDRTGVACEKRAEEGGRAKKRTAEQASASTADTNGGAPPNREAPESMNADRFSNLITTGERWALMGTPDAYVNVCAVYAGELALLDSRVKQLIANHRNNIASTAHPLHFGSVFGPWTIFERPQGPIDPEQANLESYAVKNGQHLNWHFPYPDCVLAVPMALHEPRAFRTRYLPDYQVAHSTRIAEPGAELHEGIARAAARMLERLRPSLGGAPAVAPPPVDDPDDDGLGGVDIVARHRNRDRDASERVMLRAGATAVERSIAMCDYARSVYNANSVSAVARPAGRRSVAERAATVDDYEQYAEQRELLKRAALANSDFQSQTARYNRALIDENLQQGSSRNAVRALRQSYQETASAISSEPDQVRRAVLYTVAQDRLFADYELLCGQPMSNISDKGRAINAYLDLAAACNNTTFGDTTRFVDPELSVFAHMVVYEMTALDTLHGCYAAHREFLDLTIALHDVYRYEFNLHYNVLFYGPPGVSKSWVLESMAAMAIPGTFVFVSRNTRAANDCSFDYNDVAEWRGEFPRELLVDPAESGGKSGGGAQDTSALDKFKDVTTTCMTHVQEPRRLDDGRVQNSSRRSEQVKVHCGATNLTKPVIAAAIASRMVLRELVDFNRADCAMSEKEAALLNPSREVRMLRERHRVEFRLEQAIVHHVHKLIAVGALQRPTLTVYNMTLRTFTDTLQRDYSIAVPIRSQKKLEIAIYNLVIREGVYRLYRAPGARFRGKPFAIAQLKHIDPWLKDHAELVFFVYGFLANQFVDVDRVIVMCALRRHLDSQMADPRLFEKPRSLQPTVGSGYVSENVLAGMRAAPAPQARAGQAPNREPTLPTHENDKYNWSRVRVRETIPQLAVSLETVIARDEPRRLSRQQIRSILGQMCEQTVSAHTYKRNPRFGDPTDELGSFPVVPDLSTQKTGVFALQEFKGENCIAIHSACVFAPSTDPVATAIARCAERYQPRMKMLRGHLYRPNTPHLFAAEWMYPAPDRVRVYRELASPSVAQRETISSARFAGNANDTAAARAAADRALDVAEDQTTLWYTPPAHSSDTLLIKMSLDELGTTMRLGEIALPAHPELLRAYTPFTADAAVRQAPDAMSERQLDYPADWTREDSSRMSLANMQEILRNESIEEAERQLQVREQNLRVLTSNLNPDVKNGYLGRILGLRTREMRSATVAAAARMADMARTADAERAVNIEAAMRAAKLAAEAREAGHAAAKPAPAKKVKPAAPPARAHDDAPEQVANQKATKPPAKKAAPPPDDDDDASEQGESQLRRMQEFS